MHDRAMLDDLAERREQGAAMLAGADAAIVVVADPELADTWCEDRSIVMANMQLLEAAASGVGSCSIQGRLRQAADGRSTHEFVERLRRRQPPTSWRPSSLSACPKPKPRGAPSMKALLGKVHRTASSNRSRARTSRR